MKTHDWVKGKPFLKTITALKWISSGRPVYFRHKFMSSKWVRNWSIETIHVATQACHLRRATRKWRENVPNSVRLEILFGNAIRRLQAQHKERMTTPPSGWPKRMRPAL